MNGVIWSKMQKTFVSISSVPVYAMMQQERLRQSRKLETHNFQLHNLTLTAFKETNFLEFYDNNTKVTGFCGDIWTLLSQALNFTLQPVKANVNSLGITGTNLSYQTGLLGIIKNNETDVIPKLEAHIQRLDATDFTMPLWMSGHRFYIRYDGIHDNLWMTKIFSWKVWCIIFTMYILLSVCSFWSQILLTRIKDKYKSTVFSEHLFYNFGMLCKQSYIPDILNGRSRILETSLGLFCSILSMAYGAVLFIYMTKRIFILSFDDLESLISNTNYNIIALNGSIADIAFKLSKIDSNGHDYALAREKNRFVSASTINEMYQLACSTQKEKYAIYQPEEQYYAIGQSICHLTPTSQLFIKVWITSGLAKNFKYKRSINLGILKLKEAGLLDILGRHWFPPMTENDVDTIEAIKMDQIFLMIMVICCGVIAALVVFIIEKIVYAYKLKLS